MQGVAEGRFTQTVPLRAGCLAHLRRYGRDIGQAAGQGGEVQARAAGDDGGAASRADVGQHRQDGLQPAAGRPAIGPVGHAVQMMRDARLFLRAWPGGQQAQVGIELQGVGIDDLAAQPFGQAERQGRLAAGGGAGDQDQRRLGVHEFAGFACGWA